MKSSRGSVVLDGELCRKLRLQKGWSQEALASRGHGDDALSVPTIKRAERGQAIMPSSAAPLARLLGVPLEQLLKRRAGPSGIETSSQPSIAVLPFDSNQGDEQARVFADGLVEDMINRLASFWFPVIARSSSFSLRGQALEPQEVGRKLGADYLVEGSVRSGGSRVRVAARLVDAENNRQIWGHSYDAEQQDVLTSQDRLCREIISQISTQVLEVEAGHAMRRQNVDHDAWQLALRGTWHFHRSTPDHNRNARTYLHRAIELDPLLALPRYVLVLSHQHDLLNQWSTDPEVTRREMRLHTKAFERVAPGNPWMHVAAAYSCVAHGERDEAMARLQEALNLDPNSVPAHSLYGQTLAMGSRPDQGLHELELARSLSPRDSSMWAMLMTTALAHFAAGRYADAVLWAGRAITNRPQVPMSYAALAASYAHLGDIPNAQRSLLRMRAQDSMMARDRFNSVLGATDPEIAQRFLDGLRLAGMPESA